MSNPYNGGISIAILWRRKLSSSDVDDLPKITQPVSGRAELQRHVCLISKPVLLTSTEG